MNSPRLLAMREDIAVDGLHTWQALFRNEADRFELACRCDDDPEENWDEVIDSVSASAFLMDEHTMIVATPGPVTRRESGELRILRFGLPLSDPFEAERGAEVPAAPIRSRKKRTEPQTSNPAELPAMSTPKQIAERWGVATATVRNYLLTGKLKGIRVGPRYYRVRADDIRAFEERYNARKAGIPDPEAVERTKRRDEALRVLRTQWRRERQRPS